MKITHVIHTFPPFSRAGSENYCEALAREQARDHTVEVFHRIADHERPEYEITRHQVGGLPVVRLNYTFRDAKSFVDTYRSEPVAAAFGAYLDEAQPDVVHFHHTTCLSTSCIGQVHARNLPVIYTLHDFWLLCPRGQLLRRDRSLCSRHTTHDCVRCMAYQLPIAGGHEHVNQLLARAEGLHRYRLPNRLHSWLASYPFRRQAAATEEIRARTAHVLEMCAMVDRFIAPTRFLCQQYVDFGLPAEDIVVSDYGFDLSAWQSPAEAPEEDRSRLRVAYLGTWIPSKGVHVLIEAFRELDPRRAVLDIHGYAVPYDGVDDYEAELRRLASGAPHIRLGARYDPDAVPRLLQAADVLVVPSLWYENSPLTIHEAFLAGVPVVTSGHGGMRELVRHGLNGLSFRPGSPASLRRALRRLIEDRTLLARLRTGIPQVKSIQQNATQIEAVYDEVRKTRRHPRRASVKALEAVT